MRNEDIQMPFYRVIMDVWPTLKTDLVSVQQSEEWWDGIIQKYSTLPDKYKGTIAENFALEMCLACVEQLEAMYRIQTGNMESVFGGENEQSRVQQGVPAPQDGSGSSVQGAEGNEGKEYIPAEAVQQQ